jgi:hypothetical protein
MPSLLSLRTTASCTPNTTPPSKRHARVPPRGWPARTLFHSPGATLLGWMGKAQRVICRALRTAAHPAVPNAAFRRYRTGIPRSVRAGLHGAEPQCATAPARSRPSRPRGRHADGSESLASRGVWQRCGWFHTRFAAPPTHNSSYQCRSHRMSPKSRSWRHAEVRRARRSPPGSKANPRRELADVPS